jgi:hypothetical protein
MAKTNNLCKTLKLHAELVLLSGEEMSLYVNTVYMCIHLFADLSVCVWCVWSVFVCGVCLCGYMYI